MGKDSVFQQVAEAIGAGDSVMVPKIIQALVNEKEAGLVMAASLFHYI